MTGQATSLTRHDLEAKIVKRCWEDEGFRKEFIADPADAFVKYLKAPADSLPKIFIHQEEPGSWHIVLPAKPADTDELSEQDLEKVAGGGTSAMSKVSAAVTGAITLFASVNISVAEGW
jgi:hypothetical protein